MRGKNIKYWSLLKYFVSLLIRGKFDVLLCNIGISPDVIAISELGIAHEFIQW